MKTLIWLLLMLSSVVFAQSQTTGNLIYSTVNPPPQGVNYNWSGFVTTESGGGGLQGGHIPGYNVATGQFMFGYTQATIAYSIALNTALAGSGIQVSGIQYGLQYFNQDLSRGSLSTTVSVLGKQGDVLQSYYHSLPNTTQGWTNFDQTKTFASPYALTNLGTATMTFSGQDDRFWAGYYGPQFRNPYLRLTYGADLCATNPLSSPSCPGYAQAYHDQQCAANPLYATSCAGYAAAYLTQQCSASALYSPQCPGYAEAFKTQQCSTNPLYATDCPGYAEAYKAQQCNLNGLYDRSCPNYAEAYAKANLLPAAVSQPAASPTTDSTNPAAAINDPVIKSAVVASDTTNPTSPTSVTSVISMPVPAAASVTARATEQVMTTPSTTTAAQQERAAENKKTESTVASVERRAGGNPTAARAAATERARELAREAGNAKTLEAQVATQAQVVGLIGFVPGFSAYQNALVPDTLGAQVARQYAKPTVDNRSAQRQLSGRNELRWQEMVDSQYRGK